MSYDRIEAAARHADPVLSWDALRDQGMPMDQLMVPVTDEKDPCECCGLDAEHEEQAVRLETMDRLMVYLFSDRRPEAYELVTRRVYALAKCYFPHLLTTRGPDGEILSVTLEKMGVIFDEPNTAAARATWSARLKRLVTNLVKENGSSVKAYFQKSPSACAKMSESAKGNQNRLGGKKAS